MFNYAMVFFLVIVFGMSFLFNPIEIIFSPELLCILLCPILGIILAQRKERKEREEEY